VTTPLSPDVRGASSAVGPEFRERDGGGEADAILRERCVHGVDQRLTVAWLE
jgi:hypothetical protein